MELVWELELLFTKLRKKKTLDQIRGNTRNAQIKVNRKKRIANKIIFKQ